MATRTRTRRPASTAPHDERQPLTGGKPALVAGELFQVLDGNGTWHAATVGPGVLCDANRTAARTANSAEAADHTTTVEWMYGTDLVRCGACAVLVRSRA